MRSWLAVVVVVSSMVAGTAFAGNPAGTGIVGSYHDMSKLAGENADSMGRICVFCHTPHDPGTQSSMLWSRTPSNVNYTPYVWTTPDNQGTDEDKGAFKIVDPLAGPTRLCLSCHDGLLAVDEHSGAFGQGGTRTLADIDGGRANLGTDLTKSHPIGFDYIAIREHRNSHASNQSDGDTEIVDPDKGFATAISEEQTTQGSYNRVTRTTGAGARTIKSVLFNGNIMTCSTCHDVHNKNNVIQDKFTGVAGSDPTKAPNYLLWAKEANSLICLSCHVK